MKLRTKIMGSALAASAILLANSASASVVIKTVPGGPFTSADLPLTIPAIVLNSNTTYDFIFKLADPLPDMAAGQISAQLLTRIASENLPVQFSIYEGTPTASHPEAGTWLGTSALGLSPTVSFASTPGTYYINILPSGISANRETISGSVTSAVPEPATWAVMLVGFGAIGASMRGARRRQAALAA